MPYHLSLKRTFERTDIFICTASEVHHRQQKSYRTYWRCSPLADLGQTLHSIMISTLMSHSHVFGSCSGQIVLVLIVIM